MIQIFITLVGVIVTNIIKMMIIHDENMTDNPDENSISNNNSISSFLSLILILVLSLPRIVTLAVMMF